MVAVGPGSADGRRGRRRRQHQTEHGGEHAATVEISHQTCLGSVSTEVTAVHRFYNVGYNDVKSAGTVRWAPNRARASMGAMTTTSTEGGAVAGLARLLADDTRATFCLALLDGRAWTVTEARPRTPAWPRRPRASTPAA